MLHANRNPFDLIAGANIAAFLRIHEAMMAQGVV